jgi:hypothetical protein
MKEPVISDKNHPIGLTARLVFFVMSFAPANVKEFFFDHSVSAISGRIYLPVGSTVHPEDFRETVTYRHEMVHIRQAGEQLFWQLRYVLFPGFRLRAEAEAYMTTHHAEGYLTLDQVAETIWEYYYTCQTLDEVRKVCFERLH